MPTKNKPPGLIKYLPRQSLHEWHNDWDTGVHARQGNPRSHYRLCDFEENGYSPNPMRSKIASTWRR